ncbi:MAG: S41 family peptidase, partial [Desulfobacterales bacterium]|nr:S41 family peptidase [Desulfobacterales bacterium]
MFIHKKAQIKLYIMTAIAVVFFTIGTGSSKSTPSSSDETYKGLKLFSDVIEIIEKNYVDPVDAKDLIQKAIQGMISTLDPHSQLLPPEAFEELQVDTKGEFGGIGIVITVEKGAITVVSPIEGTPAYKAGVLARDIIVKVNGESTKDMMLWEAVRKMRGPKGTKVVITVFREGAQEPIEFTLVRDIIPIESVRYVTLKPGYGYVWVTNFRDNTAQDLAKALSTLEGSKAGLKGLILDLRNNPGGLLNESVKVADIFLEKGIIVTIKGRHKKNTQEYTAHADGNRHNYPIVVLINGGSASAAEIVAGALQDNKRGLVIGTTSFGKGSVQTVEALRDGYGLKYTIALYYTPSGKSIQAQGIIPDIVIKPKMLEEDDSKLEDNYPKEKDLKNHLETNQKGELKKEPKKEVKEEPKKNDKKEEKKNLPFTEYRHGPLTAEILLSDNQVNRALEILISYD